MKRLLLGVVLISTAATAAQTYHADFTRSQWQCSQAGLAFLHRERILDIDCEPGEDHYRTCEIRLGKFVTGGFFTRTRYEAFTDFDGNTRIKLFPSYGGWSLRAAHELRSLMDCDDCLKEVEKDCHCGWPKGAFLSDNERFQVVFCVHYMGMVCPDEPACGSNCKKKKGKPVPMIDFAAEVRLIADSNAPSCVQTRPVAE